MKQIITHMVVLSLAAIALSFSVWQSSGIKGVIDPGDKVNKVWAISATDSLQAIPSQGNFTLAAKPGTYKVIVEAATPYKSFTREGVVVEDGKVADLGTIKLEQ